MHTTQKNKVNFLVDEAKTKYYRSKIVDAPSSKDRWKFCKKLLGKNEPASLPEEPSSEPALANTFNTFFLDKIHTIRNGLASAPLPYPPHLDSARPTFSGVPLSEFDQVSDADVEKVLKESPTASCSLDPTPTWMLKKCIAVFLPIITLLVNLSLASGEFCSHFKKAHVIPLLKKFDLDRNILKNYRPVSNLPFISKLIERIVSRQLIAHLIRNNLYEYYQSAYRALHSTETALLRVFNDLLQAVDQKGGAILVMLDLSAAFDTIDHAVLLQALESQCGITGTVLRWFTSYLCDREQAVKIGQTVSDFLSVVFGVPQGSVLGPIIFTLYTSPLGNIIKRHGLTYHFYADDSQLYIAFKPRDQISREEAIAKVEACTKDIKAWMTNNFLKLNGDKTELIIITSKKMGTPEFTIMIGDDIVTAADPNDPEYPPKNLGVYFDRNLSMDNHIKKLSKAISFSLFSLGKIRKYLDQPTCAFLISGLTCTRLDYCNSLLYGANETSLQKLQLLQNRAARILTFTPKYAHISNVLESLHWLPVTYRIEYKILLLCYKALNDLAPGYLKDLLVPYVPTRRLRSSDKALLSTKKSRLVSFGDKSFEVAAPLLWNALPKDLRDSVSIDIFKRQLKTHLFQKAYK